MNHGVLKDNGKITGYKAHLYPILPDGYTKKSREKQLNELKIADYALEEWAKWASSFHGYSKICSIVNVDKAMTEFKWHVPNGVEMNKDVGKVIHVFNIMNRGGSGGRVIFLQFFYLTRSHNQSVKSFFDKFNDKNQRIRFMEARKEFAQRIAVLS